jgi:hypothetical protein
MLKKFKDINFQKKTRELIEQANTIIAEYQDQGLKLTTRQLFYQFVARDILENTQRSYFLVLRITQNGRLAGVIDWDAIEDRSRQWVAWRDYVGPSEAITRAAERYHEDPWQSQNSRPEVWIEKDALAGVIEPICQEYHVPYLSCRGNLSHSVAFDAGERFAGYIDQGLNPVVLHLGDHDPNGIDMTRDLRERLEMFSGHLVEVRRLALNRNQTRTLPPNPAKETDTRYAAYVREQKTRQCWELDALSPDVIVGLIRSELDRLIDRKAWDKAKRKERRNKQLLDRVAQNWTKVEKMFKRKGEADKK